jgi:hypothetical protein
MMMVTMMVRHECERRIVWGVSEGRGMGTEGRGGLKYATYVC